MKHSYLIALVSAVLLAGLSVVPAGASTPPPGSCTSGSLTIIGTEVASSFGCSGVAVIPNSITVIRATAFEERLAVHTVVFQEGSVLTTIKNNAFSDTGLTAITIPATVTTIEFGAFALSTSLTSVTFEAGSLLTTLGDRVFESSGLTSITLPAGVTSLGYRSFYQTSSLTTVSFAAGSSLSSIGSEAFVYSSLTTIRIPASVSSIGTDAFERTDQLETVVFEPGSILTSLPAGAFHYSGLSSISLPASLQTIGASAFYNNQRLSSITLPQSLTGIGNDAFGSTSSLTSLRFEGLAAPTLGTGVFTGSGPSATASIKFNATGFDLVSGLWSGLLISRDAAPAPDPVSTSPAPLPQLNTKTPAITKSFVLDTPVLAKQQKKVLRTLIAEVGAGGSFEVVAGISAREGLGKKALRALAREKASAIKKYLVKRGVKKRDVTVRVKIYKVGASPDSHVLGSKPKSS